jgi:hypothetical protein
MRVAFRTSLLLALLLLVCGGCNSGPRLEHVGGTVSCDGQPVENGTLELIPIADTDGPSMGSAIVNGRFDVPAKKGARSGGTYKVVITALRPSSKTVPNIFDPSGKPLALGEQFIPPRYNTQSELTIVISTDAGQNEHHFELEGAEISSPESKS